LTISGDETMKYTIYRTFQLQIEANDKKEAMDIAGETDMKDWEFKSDLIKEG
jgi:hypothetical protein